MVFHSKAIEFRQATIDEILQLRHDVLIVGTKRTSSHFPGDTDASTHHFGAFDRGSNVGCLSFMSSEYDRQPAYQLRGMATHPEYRLQSIGKRLLQYAEHWLQSNSGVTLLWCNAREGVETFYTRQGWKIMEGPFMIENVCMHYKMMKRLQPS